MPERASKTVEMRGPWGGETVTLAVEGAGDRDDPLSFRRHGDETTGRLGIPGI